jgi:hypothetical protein
MRASFSPKSCMTANEMQSVSDHSLSGRLAYKSNPARNISDVAGTMTASGPGVR